MSSQAVIIGDSEFSQGTGALQAYPSFRASAKLYYDLLDQLEPFQSNCTLIPSADDGEQSSGVDADAVMDAIADAAERAKSAEDTLLVVYVGHGMAWGDLHGGEVHFAMSRSREDRPWNWLPYSSVRREMAKKRDGLRIVIADCCYSNFLHRQGGSADDPPRNTFALMEKDQGTAIFTAVDPDGRNPKAWPMTCNGIDPEMRECTHFSGHFLQVLKKGSRFAGDMLSLGDMRDIVREAMRTCNVDHPVGGLILRGPSDSTPFVQNPLPPGVEKEIPAPASEEDWIRALRSGRSWPIADLLSTPAVAGRVSLRLWEIPEARGNAKRIDLEANRAYRKQPHHYASYWHVRDGLAA